MGDEGSFPLVSILDPDVVVTPTDIELGEDLCSFELVYKVRGKGEGVGIPNGVLIQVVVVLAWAETAILLFHKEEGSGLGGV